MINNVNEAINIVLTIFIFYYLMNNIFEIDIFKSSLQENFINTLLNKLNNLTPLNFLKENLTQPSIIKPKLLKNRQKSITKSGNSNKVSKTDTEYMLEQEIKNHLDNVIENYDKYKLSDSSSKSVDGVDSNNEYITSDYKPFSNNIDKINKQLSMDFEKIDDYNEIKLNVGEPIKNNTTDINANEYSVNTYTNENSLSGGNDFGVDASNIETHSYAGI